MPQAIPTLGAMAAGASGLAAGGGMLATVSSGLMLAGGGLSLIGQMTGSKALKTVGGITAGVGGLGTIGAGVVQGEGLLSGAKGLFGGSSAAPSSSTSTGLSGAMASAPPRTMKDFEKSFLPGTMETGALATKADTVTKTFDKAMLGDLSNSLKKFDSISTLLGGMGQGYIAYEQQKLGEKQLGVQQQKVDLERERQQFEIETLKKKQANLASVPQIRISQPPTGLLGR